MTVTREQLKPGTVVVVPTHDFGAWWIRLRARLMRQPSLQNHVVMFTNFDSEGIPRGFEGRPSGAGPVNMTKYLAEPNAISNAEQPIPDTIREELVRLTLAAYGRPYDWVAILSFALQVFGVRFAAREWPEDGLPSHVECASVLDLFYESMKLPNPGTWRKTRGTDPDDWATFILNRQWARFK